MDDKRTPMEAEVQELPVEAETICPDNSYGTAARPKPRRSYAGLLIWMGIAVIAFCSVCVVAAAKHISLENGENGWRLSFQIPENTVAEEETVRNLDTPDAAGVLTPEEPISKDYQLPVAQTVRGSMNPEDIYESIMPAVVCVEMNGYYTSETCTGVVITSDGCILTAYDSLSGVVSITVTLSDGTSCIARKLREDPTSCVCLLKVEAEGLPTADFAAGTNWKVGQRVYSVSNPYGGQFPSVFREGLISFGNTREINGTEFHLLQSSSDQDSLEYGCPILDDHGLILGITTPIGRRLFSGGDPCFAVSSVDLARILTDFDRTDQKSSLWLGIEVSDLSEGLSDYLGYPGSVWIDDVPRGSAAYGNLFKNDVILSVDGHQLNSSAEYESIIASHEVGDRILVTIFRGGRIRSYIMTVVKR